MLFCELMTSCRKVLPGKSLKAERKLWREIARNLPLGVGKISDRYALEMLVRLLVKERADTINNGAESERNIVMI